MSEKRVKIPQSWPFSLTKTATVMIILNITFNVNKEATNFLSWMQQHHIPAVMTTKLPSQHKVLRLLTNVDMEGDTYSFQYFFEDMGGCLDFQVMYFDNMIRQIDQHFRGKFVFFDTILEEVIL